MDSHYRSFLGKYRGIINRAKSKTHAGEIVVSELDSILEREDDIEKTDSHRDKMTLKQARAMVDAFNERF